MTGAPDDPWTLMYTSGTTGKPEGRHPQPPRQRAAVAGHRDRARLQLATTARLLVMPMCHANSLYFFGAFAYCGAACTGLLAARASIPSTSCGRWPTGGSTFTSLVPTHYIMMLGLPRRSAQGTTFDAVTKLMISSAPARRETKLAIMEMFQQLRPVRALRLDRSRLGHHAASATSSSPSSARSGANASARAPIKLARRGRQRGAATARPASSTRATPTPSTATGSCRRRPGRLSAATIARSATWPAATRTATSISSTARAT